MKKIAYILFLFLLFSCNLSHTPITLYDKIDNYSKENKKDSFQVDLKNIVNFDWDTLYIINNSVMFEELNNILGFEYPYYSEFSDRIIFVKNKKVVYHEDIPIKFSGIDMKGGGLLLKFPTDVEKKYIIVNRRKTLFNVYKDENVYGETCYYFTFVK